MLSLQIETDKVYYQKAHKILFKKKLNCQFFEFFVG